MSCSPPSVPPEEDPSELTPEHPPGVVPAGETRSARSRDGSSGDRPADATVSPEGIAPQAAAAPAAPDRLDRVGAEDLGARIQERAAQIAEATCGMLLLVGEFDAREGSGWFVGLKSTAHWLSWACSMSPGTAREHVRVARALPSMPRTVEEFRAGRLSYSKVRELTRVVGRVEEEALVELARGATASQLARVVSSFRAIDGSRLGQDAVREARWHTREDGMIEIRAVLPPESGAEVLAALELALSRDGHDIPASSADSREGSGSGAASRADADADTANATATTSSPLEQRRADAIVEVARGFLEAAPTDRSGEDRHLVVVQVSAEALTADPVHDVPAGTFERCGVVGGGPLEARTAERLACTRKVAVAITDSGGEVLHLGRSRRLASRAQRRALRLRDGTCLFPGCHQTRHLEAHHVTPWSEGGLTDIEGLALLCRRHHVIVHEGGLHLTPAPRTTTPGLPRFSVVDAEGRLVQARWPAMLEHVSARQVPVHPDETPASSALTAPSAHSEPGASTDNHDPSNDAASPPPAYDRIAATTGGDGFRLADCVEMLCASAIGLAA